MEGCSRVFVKLDKTIHDRNSFDCGKDELNAFLQKKAAAHSKLDISRTMVLPADIQQPNGKFEICSFYTSSMTTISREVLPNQLAKRLPVYPIPVFLLAQMAAA